MTVHATLPILLITFLVSVNALAQHDPGRNAVRLLAREQVEAAVELAGVAPGRRNSAIGEAERCFVLAMAACRRKDAAAAFGYAKQAVDKGLPVERLQAGPREAFASLYAHDAFKAWMKTRRKPLLHGPMLGALTDASARFWVRTAEEADVRVVVCSIPDDAPEAVPLVGEARTSGERDYTATIGVSGLKPNTRYTYDVFVDGGKQGPRAQFRTFPAQGRPARFSVAFGGGAGFTPKHERMWTTLGGREVSALLLLGDNVYIDDPQHALTQRYCYYRRQSREEWRQLVSSVGVYAIYDDHDFGTNDCIPGPDIEEPGWKRQVWERFTRNWVNPSYAGGSEQPGCWYDFRIGDVHFIMLDTRYYRDLTGGSMLGPVQKKWLFETLKSSDGTFKILASSVPWSPGVKGRSKDTWDGFPDEREEVFSLIEKHRINGVLLMAADRHRSDLRRIPRERGYDLHEMMSSRLTNVHTHPLVEGAKGSEFIMGYNATCSFGLMQFDTTAEDPLLTYTIVTIDNEEVDSRRFKLSDLSCPQGES